MRLDNDMSTFDFEDTHRASSSREDWDMNIFDCDIADSYNTDDSRSLSREASHRDELCSTNRLCENDDYKPITGYPNYIINRNGVIRNINRDNQLKHIFSKRGGGPRVSLSKNGERRSFLVSKLLISVFKFFNFNLSEARVDVYYKDHNPRNISLENIYADIHSY